MYYALDECYEHTLSRNKRREGKKDKSQTPESSNQNCSHNRCKLRAIECSEWKKEKDGRNVCFCLCKIRIKTTNNRHFAIRS